jgi:UDP-glucose 4-epimerase
MRILITGGSGFIGSHVVDKLLAKGHEVKIFDIVQPKHDIGKAQHCYGSLLELDDIVRALEGIDAIYHLAAIADVKNVFEEPHYSERVNVGGTMNILEAARKTGVKRIIYGGTDWVYSNTDDIKVDENTLLRPPTHLYTTTKLVSEFYCRNYSDLYGIDYTILRYGIPYGPRARPGAVVPIFVNLVMNGKPITLAGGGSQFRQFVYVEDLAEGNALAANPVARNKIYNLDGKEKITIRQVAETVQKVLGKQVEIKNVPARPGDFQGREVSSERARADLGWEPKVSFEEGVRRYVEWFKSGPGKPGK